ncbi:MAG: GGDEF domain-containing protein [Zetaproteobacteria bacterium CG_4_9_14_3_um_filter_49_83]|nr:MAG: hypothetical protein AUJ56_09955 [Zetaproteobacteria bacterium CG1_02_49_23]PIQ34225.1 MAG: GGDEF domain-containing protein [Zetaproteobacteria bacterium CG17_big_fil_post_rev_8_21_14_2_50_50_13]PIY57144.1 MAG: GGDEF domain-containing protein [Zetaproteobacteria bacterium CG_4_10_14_0_8_um_filter_49_80]PJA33949.1 MAG: GGDEF domain-containing protein [Zetaproteobacteria bacterium CG_4_9_14_3_um_filter_49_83]
MLQNKEFYQKLFIEASDAMAVADAETGELLNVNHAMERLVGWQREALIGKSQKILHPDSGSDPVTPSFARHSNEMAGKPIESQVLTRQGELRDVEIKAAPVVLQGRHVILGFFRDITDRKCSERALFESNELLERVFANLRMLIAYMDTDFNFIRVNHTYAAADGRSPESFVGKNHFDLYPDAQNEAIFRQVVASGEPHIEIARPFVYEHDKARGISYWDWNLQAVKDSEGAVTGVILSLVDVTGEKRVEQAMRLWRRVIDASTNAIIITDATQKNMPIVYVNPAFEHITGYSAAEVMGRNPAFLHGSDINQPELEHLRQALRQQRDGNALLRNYRKNGEMYWSELFISPVWDEQGMLTHYVGISRDVTADKHYEAELERLSNHDSLTGLANRILLRDRLTQAIAFARRMNTLVGVLFVDLDRFKMINDSLGHHVGDHLLQVVGQRLQQLVCESDTVARLGGDEFVLVLSNLTSYDDLNVVANKLLEAVGQPLQVDGHELYTSPSIGIACYPRDGEDEQNLLKQADAAMYHAKECGRNTFCFYTPDMDEAAQERLTLANALHYALEKGEFVLHYQPQVALHNGEIVGVEALVRWQSPEKGLVPPDQFIPLAEESDLIIKLGRWVLYEACTQARAWLNQGITLTMAVNLSVRQLISGTLVQSVREILQQTGLPPYFLELELTESHLAYDPESMARILKELDALGIGLALDDFGTGYSSLSYLKQLPIGKIKIDRSFVRDIGSDSNDATLVRTIIAMAHNLRLGVVAEGVEDAEQLMFLRAHHCNEIQGYYISRPLPADALTPFIEAHLGTSAISSVGAEEFAALLLVDDDEATLAVLGDTLALDGHRVLRARGPRQALQLLAQHHVGVVISDQRMPEMSGVALLHKVKYLYPDTIRMLLTGYSDVDTVTGAVNEGAVYKFMSKPWDIVQLRSNLRDAFCQYEIHRAWGNKLLRFSLKAE